MFKDPDKLTIQRRKVRESTSYEYKSCIYCGINIKHERRKIFKNYTVAHKECYCKHKENNRG